MGINWSMEIISMTVRPQNRIFFIISDLLNVLAGVFVFCIFVLKRKVLHGLKTKFCRGRKNERNIERATGFTTSTTSSIILNFMNSHKSIDNIP